MILEIKLSWKDYLAGMRLHKRPSTGLRLARIILVLAAGFAYCYVVSKVFKVELNALSTFPLLLSLISIFLWYVVYLPYKADKVYHEQKALQEPYSLEVVEDGLEYASAVASSHLTWDYFPKWKESDRVFLLYHSDDLFQVIPKSSFKDQDMKAFKDTLTANVKKLA